MASGTLIRDQTHVPYFGSMESLTTGPPGKSPNDQTLKVFFCL